MNYDDDLEDHSKSSAAKAEEPPEPPCVPQDLSTLAQFQLDQAMPGMAITWKQWLLSQATNWEPQIRNVSGTIMDVNRAADTLGIILAARDRELEESKEYDEEEIGSTANSRLQIWMATIRPTTMCQDIARLAFPS